MSKCPKFSFIKHHFESWHLYNGKKIEQELLCCGILRCQMLSCLHTRTLNNKNTVIFQEVSSYKYSLSTCFLLGKEKKVCCFGLFYNSLFLWTHFVFIFILSRFFFVNSFLELWLYVFINKNRNCIFEKDFLNLSSRISPLVIMPSWCLCRKTEKRIKY